MMSDKNWLKEPMRVMQFNLQVNDTPMMDPVTIARETEEMYSNVVVMNVGGIYAWYNSRVKYHHINEHLPKDRDLLEELINEFHKKNIKFIARFDFSITDGTTYLAKPQWFARHKDKQPYYRGEKRMGNWSLFLNTCALGGYRNEDVAIPVINEVLEKYDIDGIFFNAPHASACFCERCQNKYLKLYGKVIPDTPQEFEEDWLSICMEENIGNVYKAIKTKRPEVPMILYYSPYTTFSTSFGRNDRDSIYDRYATADLICTESQNILSKGVNEIPETIHPIMAMKSGQLENREKLPFGIIHSCPGMDWRHVGMPIPEYLPWMCQVPASGGILWHSVTGYNSTITDKRIIDAVTKVNKWIAKSENDMNGAKSKSEVLLLWDGVEAGKGWAEALVKNHIQFDLMHDYHINTELLPNYKVIVCPDGFISNYPVMEVLKNYIKQGGSVLVENTDSVNLAENQEIFGIEGEITTGEYLVASYLKFENCENPLNKGMDTDKIGFKGAVSYCTPAEKTEVLSTLIPPFAPYEVVGAPPERASIPMPQTDIPLTLINKLGNGKIMLLPFALNQLILEYRLLDHYQLVGNMIDILIGQKRELEVKAPHAVQVTMYEKTNQLLVHFVNEVGQRPLIENVPVRDLSFSLMLKPNQKIANVRSVIGEINVKWDVKGGRVFVSMEQLDIWDLISIDLES